ncbi:meiosis-specific with OB domain-containing protein-like isoform X2 [Vespa mandarinia]|uniref:meiosis-specific with OB domain-containing protein-like isoform X2 n=1 Tax=Vespa mandarinia TaxID=7446 RepID=UPI0016166BE2|nr:meiosis-specific with OB domain-containing protein-like isoform X2 [Vespa mandarinia]
MSGICKQVLRSLKPGAVNSLVIGIIINSLNVRTFDASRTRFNNGERAVWTFTLRDSEEDFINVTVWGTVDFVKKLVATFRIGTIVEVINAKIIARQAEDRDEMFVPLVSIPYKLIVNEGIALIQKHDAPIQHIYEKLLTIPTRSVKSLQTLKFLLHQIENLCDQYVDILVVITFVSGERNIVTRDGRKLKCRNFEATDGSSDSSIVFILWENEWVERAASWQPKYTVLFLADARIIFDKFKKKMVISIVRRTLIIENPNIPETELVRKAVDHYCRDVLSTDSFAVPNQRLNQGTIVKDGRLQFATILKAIVTDMNVDDTNPSLISTRCALCKKPVIENRDSCMNLDCPCGNGTRAPFNATTINVKVNLKDDSGYLIGCRLSGEGAECAFNCTAAEFQAMTVAQRADLKWKYILEKCDIRLHVLGPTSLFPRALYNILSIRPITEENMEQNQLDETHNI